MTNININHFNSYKTFFENNLHHMKTLCKKTLLAIDSDKDFRILCCTNEASSKLWYMLTGNFDKVVAEKWIHRILELNNRMFNKNYIINDKVFSLREGGLFGGICANLPKPNNSYNKLICMKYYVEMFKIMDDYKETMEKEYKINTDLVQSNVLFNNIKNL